MKIRIFSDLHVEFEPFKIPPLSDDKDTVCVLAGDIGVVDKISSLEQLLQQACNMFKNVIYVFGNHEFYHGSIINAHQKLLNHLAHFHVYNLHVIENETVVIDDVAFIGATLWTDFDRNPLACYNAEKYMNDYKYIRTGTIDAPYINRLRAEHVSTIHNKSRRYIFESIKEHKQHGRKTVVVTHHGVSDLSIATEFRGDSLNSAYVSNLAEEIFNTQPDVMIHGHVHRAQHYALDNTRIYVNPRGYPGEKSGFDPLLIVEV